MKKIAICLIIILVVASLAIILVSCNSATPKYEGTYYYYDTEGFHYDNYMQISGNNWKLSNGDVGTIKFEVERTNIFGGAEEYYVSFYTGDILVYSCYCNATTNKQTILHLKNKSGKYEYFCLQEADLSMINDLPQVIATKEDFLEIYNVRSGVYKEYDIVNDIDLEGSELFSGTTAYSSMKLRLNGRNHTISNFKVSSSTYAGLFQQLESSEVINLKIANAKIYGARSGALSGNALNSKFDNIVINNDVVVGDGSNSFTGGIVGFANGCVMSNCSNHATVKGINSTGGILGKAYNSDIYKCNNYGNINFYGDSACGGIVGFFEQYWESYSGHTEYFYDNNNYGTVNGRSANNIGGLIGRITRGKPSIRLYDDSSDLKIAGCKNYGSVTGNSSIGGIVGLESKSDDRIKTIVSFTNCSNIGTVRGDTSVGGILGYGENNITFNNCSNEFNEDKSNGVSGYYSVGGIVSVGNFFTHCANNGLVEFNTNEKDNSCLGGITGSTYQSAANFVACENNGIVRGYKGDSTASNENNSYSGTYVGGIAGLSSGGKYIECKNTGSVYGNTDIAALIGKLIPAYETSIIDCEANGEIMISKSGRGGGFVGRINYSNVLADSTTKQYSATFVLSDCSMDLKVDLEESCKFGYCVGTAYSNSTSGNQYGKANIRDCKISLDVNCYSGFVLREVYSNSYYNDMYVLIIELDSEDVKTNIRNK